jgi:hypothetical protein
MTKLVIAGAVLCWALTALNAYLYFKEGETFSMLAFFWCLAMATWTTYNAMSCWLMDRDERSWRR